MIIGDRLKTLREGKQLSQGDIEKRTGLLRCYVSRVENGHTVPSVETLEKFARALELPLHHLLYDGDEPPPMKSGKASRVSRWENSRSGATLMRKLIPLLARMDERGKKLILLLAARGATKERRAGRVKTAVIRRR
jgi:transcriptional regulator with XRE-family HTH domain